jgi:hypothetical protein
VAADVASGIAHFTQAAEAGRDRAFAAGRGLIRQSALKEARALESVRRLAPRGRAAEVVRDGVAGLDHEIERGLAVLESAYEGIAGRNPPNLDLSKEERAMAAKVFTLSNDVARIQDAKETLKNAGGALHGMMAFETLNLADGRRNAYEIYEAVAAQALSAGTWYYGEVQPGDVMSLLEKAAEAGILTQKAAR